MSDKQTSPLKPTVKKMPFRGMSEKHFAYFFKKVSARRGISEKPSP